MSAGQTDVQTAAPSFTDGRGAKQMFKQAAPFFTDGRGANDSKSNWPYPLFTGWARCKMTINRICRIHSLRRGRGAKLGTMN